MNYYEEIKNELINNEVYKKVKDYSKNKSDLQTYYNVGKLLSEAGKHYGESIIKKYSEKLTSELGKGYSQRNLRNMRRFYIIFKDGNWQPVAANLTWTNINILLSLNDINKINYYVNICINNNLSKRELQSKINNKEYERLPQDTKDKLINKEVVTLPDMVKNPIIIKNKYDTEKISINIRKEIKMESHYKQIENLLKNKKQRDEKRLKEIEEDTLKTYYEVGKLLDAAIKEERKIQRKKGDKAKYEKKNNHSDNIISFDFTI